MTSGGLLKRNLIANYLGQGWTGFVSLAFIPVYVGYLGVESYGLIGFFGMLTSWLSLVDAGMTPTLAREMARFSGGGHSAQSIRDLLRSIEIVAAVAAVATFIVIHMASEWIAGSWLKTEQLPVADVARAFSIMGLVVALRFLEGLYRSSLIGLQRQVQFNAISSLLATIRALGAVAILEWISPTIQAFFLWQAIVSTATLVVLLVVTYGLLPRADRIGRFSIKALRGVSRFAGGMFGGTCLLLLLTQIDKILLSRTLELSAFGYYTLAATAAGTITLLGSPVSQAWYPRLSQLQAQADRAMLIRTFHMGAQLISVIVGTAGIVLSVFADVIMLIWTQDAVIASHTADLVRVLTVGGLLNGMMWIPYQTQLAHGWTGLVFRMNLVAVLVIVPCLLWAVPQYGAMGAAWVWVALNVGYVLIAAHFMFKRIIEAEKWGWYLHDVALPLLAALVTCMIFRVAFSGIEGRAAQSVGVIIAGAGSVIAASFSAVMVREQLLRYLSSFRIRRGRD